MFCGFQDTKVPPPKVPEPDAGGVKMKLFYIAAFVIDGREKRPVSWFVFSKDDREACKHIAGKYSVGGLGRVSIISIEEIEPEEGLLLKAR